MSENENHQNAEAHMRTASARKWLGGFPPEHHWALAQVYATLAVADAINALADRLPRVDA